MGDKPALGLAAAATAASSSSSSLVLLPAVYPSGKSLIDMTASSSFTTMTAFLHDALRNAFASHEPSTRGSGEKSNDYT